MDRNHAVYLFMLKIGRGNGSEKRTDAYFGNKEPTFWAMKAVF